MTAQLPFDGGRAAEVSGVPSPPPGAPGTTLAPGIYPGIPMEDYVRDRISPEPSLSTGTIAALDELSPLHARTWHPRLDDLRDDGGARADLGSAAHSAIFGGAPVVYAPAEFEDWKKKAAQDFRNEARALGRIPLLDSQRGAIDAIVLSAYATLKRAGLWTEQRMVEHTMLWRDSGVWCRARPDLVEPGPLIVVDLKTATCAEPRTWKRTVLDRSKYPIQGTHVLRGLYELTERNYDFIFMPVEIEPPFASSLVRLTPNYVDVATKKIERATGLWRECLRTNRWPSYDEAIYDAEPPAWMMDGIDDPITFGGEVVF